MSDTLGRRVFAWIEKRAAWLLVGALASIVFASSMTFHEYWRDECQAVLLAEETPFSELLGQLRYEGHPPLLHVLLKLVSLVLPRPFALSFVGALGFATLVGGTYHWFRAFTPASARFALLCTGALTATYTYGYELGIVARGYGYGIGLALLGAALAKRRSLDDAPKRFVWVALCLGGSIISALHTACLASSIALVFVVDALRRPGDRVARTKRLALGFGLPLVPFVLVLMCVVIEPSDRAFAWIPTGFHVPPDPLDVLWNLTLRMFTPRGWWSMEWELAPFVITVGMIIAIAYVMYVQSVTDQLGWFLGAVMLSSLGLVVLSVFRYFGEYRHHTVLVVPWVLCMVGAVLAQPRKRQTLIVAIPLALWFAHQTWLLVGSVRRDVVQSFSQTQEAARVLPDGAKLVSSHDVMATCISYLRPDVELRAPQGRGRVYTFVHWDRDRSDVARLDDVVAGACAGRSSTYLALPGRDARHADRFPLGRNLISKIDRSRGLAQTGEYFELYEVSCSSLRSPSR